MKDDYYFQMYYDDLPIWGFIGKIEKILKPGQPEMRQGLTPIHISAQPEPFLKQKPTLNTTQYPLIPPNIIDTTPHVTPYPTQSAYVELRSGRV